MVFPQYEIKVDRSRNVEEAEACFVCENGRIYLQRNEQSYRRLTQGMMHDLHGS